MIIGCKHHFEELALTGVIGGWVTKMAFRGVFFGGGPFHAFMLNLAVLARFLALYGCQVVPHDIW